MNITPFNFDSHTVRVITDGNGNPTFVARDVAATLGYVNTRKAVTDHCKHAKSLIDIGVTIRHPQQNQELDPQTKLIPESVACRPGHTQRLGHPCPRTGLTGEKR